KNFDPAVEHLSERMERSGLCRSSREGDVDLRQLARFFRCPKTLSALLDRGGDSVTRFIEQLADDRTLFLAKRFHPIGPGGNAAGATEVADTGGLKRLLVGRGGAFRQRGITQLFQLVRHGERL